MARSQSPSIWVTRAQPGASETGARLSQLGLTPVVAPLIATRPLAFSPPSEGFDALAFTSAAAVRAFAAAVEDRDRPVFAVGAGTAAEALQQGWRRVTSAEGDVAALAALILAAPFAIGRLLHPGARVLAGDLAGSLSARNIELLRLPVYETAPVAGPDLPDLEGLYGALLHSPSAARALARHLETGAPRPHLRIFALSAACAAPIPPHQVGEIVISPFPREAALLKVLMQAVSISS